MFLNTNSTDNSCDAVVTTNASYWDYHHHWYPMWYPTYVGMPEKSNVEQAFKIVGKLIDSGIVVKDLNVKEFIKLVNDIAGIL